jgi:hypothetical protein
MATSRALVLLVFVSLIRPALAQSEADALARSLPSPAASPEFRGLGEGIDELKVQGPWAYAQRFDVATKAMEYVAATPAKEDADTWLLLACGTGARATAALMHVSQFSFPVQHLSRIVLRANDSPTFAVDLAAIRKNQLTITPEVARHLLPLFIESREIVAFIAEPGTAPRHYTFSLQPNDRALAGIADNCIP